MKLNVVIFLVMFLLCVKIYKKHYVFHNARTLCVVQDAVHNKKHYEKHNVSPGCVTGVLGAWWRLPRLGHSAGHVWSTGQRQEHGRRQCV
jgi:hypothetical protein